MRIAPNKPTAPDQYGQMHFIGNPFELQEGDTVFDGEYAVLRMQPAKHNGEDATQLTLCDPGAYDYEVPKGGVPQDTGRAVLPNGMLVRFTRTVTDFDFGQEDEIFEDLEFCVHDEHEKFIHKVEIMCKDLQSGVLVGINLQRGGPVKPECKIIDSVYENGAVIFTDGTAFQSHPNKTWMVWTR